MDDDTVLREELLAVLDGVGVHMPFEEAVAQFPDEAINRRPANVEYTPWHLLEHLRITQADILDYIRNPDHVEMEWPKDHWPARDATATRAQFEQIIDAFRADQTALHDLAADPATNLFATIPNTPAHTIVRELRVVGAQLRRRLLAERRCDCRRARPAKWVEHRASWLSVSQDEGQNRLRVDLGGIRMPGKNGTPAGALGRRVVDGSSRRMSSELRLRFTHLTCEFSCSPTWTRSSSTCSSCRCGP
jgi:hypothetical protein